MCVCVGGGGVGVGVGEERFAFSRFMFAFQQKWPRAIRRRTEEGYPQADEAITGLLPDAGVGSKVEHLILIAERHLGLSTDTGRLAPAPNLVVAVRELHTADVVWVQHCVLGRCCTCTALRSSRNDNFCVLC